MKRKSKEELFRKTICELIRSNYYADELNALKLIYERLVIEGVIDEFQFDMELWNEFKEKIPFSHTSYLMYFKDSNSKIDFSVVMLLQEKYPYFMGIINERKHQL